MSVEAIAQRRAERREAAEKARAAQYETDLAALDAAEEQYGCDRVKDLRLSAHVAGLPTMLVVRAPVGDLAPHFKKFRALASSEKGSKLRQAGEDFARACVVYPTEKETLAAMHESFPMLLDAACLAATNLAQATEEERGKE